MKFSVCYGRSYRIIETRHTTLLLMNRIDSVGTKRNSSYNTPLYRTYASRRITPVNWIPISVEVSVQGFWIKPVSIL